MSRFLVSKGPLLPSLRWYSHCKVFSVFGPLLNRSNMSSVVYDLLIKSSPSLLTCWSSSFLHLAVEVKQEISRGLGAGGEGLVG